METNSKLQKYFEKEKLDEKFKGKYFKYTNKVSNYCCLIYIEKLFIEKCFKMFQGIVCTYRGNEFSFKIGRHKFSGLEQNFKDISKKEYRRQIHNHFDKII